MSALIDLSGKTFAMLTVIEFSRSTKKWSYVCECGAQGSAASADIRSGKVRSCGCYRASILRSSGLKHGMCGTGAWHSWRDMIKRCTNPKADHFKDYGARGIAVCDEWQSFEGFHKSMGDRPRGFSLERDDVDGNYEPGNCRWIPLGEQCLNKRNTVLVTVNGQQMALSEACKKAGSRYSRVRDRMQKLGWSFEKAVSEPKKINGTKYHAEAQR
jgi:hypothetical protein